MSVRGWSPGKEVIEPRGMWSAVAQKRKGSPSRASFMQNLRVAPAVVTPRPGVSAAFTPLTGRITGLFNWIAPSGNNYVLFEDHGNIKALLQPNTLTQLIAATAYRPVFAEFDIWVYLCGYDTDSNGTMQVEIYDGARLDKAFRGPITPNSVTPTDAGPGYCSEGAHSIAFVYQNRTGFAGVPTSKAQVQVGLTTSSYPSGTPPTFHPSGAGSTLTARPTVLLNGWGPNGHLGAYEKGVDQAFNWGYDSGSTEPYAVPEMACDGNPNTYATRGWAGSHHYAGCVWSFGAPIRKPGGSVSLNIYSWLQNGATARSAGIWHSLDGGSTWTQIYNSASHPPGWDNVALPDNQDLSQVQVMAFLDSHDQITHYVRDISITYAASEGDIHGAYENPAGVISGAQTFSGYASSDYTHVLGVLVYVDAHYIGQATYGASRPEIADAYPDSPDNPNVGFTLNWDVGPLAAGSHFWYAIAYLDDGRAWQTDSIPFTIAANPRKLNIAVSVPALNDGGGSATLFLIMTRSDNPASWYWMPDDTVTGSVGSQPVPLNAAATLHFVANYTDEDMAASLDSANEQFLLLTQDANGSGPFNPSFVVPYGNRMCYGAGSNLYVSDAQDPQHLTADQHLIFNPSKRVLGYAFPLPGSTDLYLTGDRWTSRVTDSGDKPATWGPPIKISDSLGAKFASCVCFRTGGNYAWVACEGGVYRFTGEYGGQPLTYLVTDHWKRVNWGAAHAVEMADDVAGLRLYVAVPLDGATTPTHLFVIDYTNGLDFNQVDISLDRLIRPTFGSVGIVKEQSSGLSNVWLGSSGDTSGAFPLEVTVVDSEGNNASLLCSITVASSGDGGDGGGDGGGGGGGTITALSFVGVDVGSVPTPGYTQTSATQLVIEGYSNTPLYRFFDRSSSPDSFQFAYVASTPPITLTGRIAAKTGDGASCAMVRTSLVPGAPNVAIGPRSPGLGGFAGAELYYRDVNSSAGGDAQATGGPDAPPFWVRVSYQATGTATVYWSLDGSTWAQIGSDVIIVPFAQAAATPIYIGFAVGGYPMIETIDHISVVLA